MDRLATLKTSLDNVDSLRDVADDVRAFRADPNQPTLATLAASGAAVTPPLRQLKQDLDEMLDPLKDISGSLGTLVAFFVYLTMLVWPMVAMGWVVSLYQRGIVSLDRINKIMDTEPKVISSPDSPNNKRSRRKNIASRCCEFCLERMLGISKL